MSNIKEKLDSVGKPIIVATHPRSGTHLTIDLLRKQFKACKGWLWPGETLHHLYLNIDRLSEVSSHPVSIEKAVRIICRPQRPTLKTHSLPDFAFHARKKKQLVHHLIKTGDVVYVIRDGRDVLCSAYAWRGTSQDTLSEFLREPVNGRSRVRSWAEHVMKWTQNDVHIVQFEDIIQQPRQAISELGTYLNMSPLYVNPYLPKRIEHDSRWADYWRRLTRNFESTTIVGRRNVATPPDWHQAFTESDRRFFWEEAGNVLDKFGYETSDSWTKEFS